MEFDTILYEESEGVAVVTLNRPEVHNAFSDRMQEELGQVWRDLRSNNDVRAIVLTGAGERAFCTGMDRSDFPDDGDDYIFDPYTYEDPGRSIGPRSQGLWKPVIAAVNGMACGGAFYFLGQADFIIAAEHATFFDPHVTYGMPAVFEPALLASKMPFGELMRMTLMGNHERISAARAESIGLVTQVVPGSELQSTAHRLAAIIASQPAAAVQASLRSLWAARDVAPHAMIDIGNIFLNLSWNAQAIQGSQAAFSNRKPEPPIIR